jgi:hypothetical protein
MVGLTGQRPGSSATGPEPCNQLHVLESPTTRMRPSAGTLDHFSPRRPSRPPVMTYDSVRTGTSPPRATECVSAATGRGFARRCAPPLRQLQPRHRCLLASTWHTAGYVRRTHRAADNSSSRDRRSAARQSGGAILPRLLRAGAGGVILGIIALLGISTLELTAIAVIAFGSALILSSNSALRLHFFKLAKK